jgi:hypothetical protein
LCSGEEKKKRREEGKKVGLPREGVKERGRENKTKHN